MIAYAIALTVASRKPLAGVKKIGSRIPITISTARQRPREPRRQRVAPFLHLGAQFAHPASRVSSPIRPRGRRIMIAIR